MQKFCKFCLENAIHGTIDVEISLAKGIVFTKIGLANGAILKLWAAHPYLKFSQEPSPRVSVIRLFSFYAILRFPGQSFTVVRTHKVETTTFKTPHTNSFEKWYPHIHIRNKGNFNGEANRFL